MLDPKLVESIDACRPGSRDVEQPEQAHLAAALASDPEARAMYAAVQRFDTRLTSSMHEVPVPADLADRILNRLATATQSDAVAVGSSTAVTLGSSAAVAIGAPATGPNDEAAAVETAASGVSSAGTLARRRWIAAASCLAASLLLAAGLWLAGRPGDARQLAVTEKAAAWYDHLGDGWQPVAQTPKGFSMPSGIGGTVRGWQWVAKTVAKGGVVYDLGGGPHAGAVLFVVKATQPELPSSAPRMPQSTTAGLAIGAWQSGGLMYVLVVRGDEQAYKKFLRPTQPLA